MVGIEEWTGPGAKELPNEHRPLQPGDNCVFSADEDYCCDVDDVAGDDDDYCEVDDGTGDEG